MAFNVVSGLFEQLAVLHAAGAGGLAGPTAKTEIDRADGRWSHGESALLQCPHEINSPTGRVVFVPGLQVRGTGGQAETAMNAGQRLLMIQEVRGLVRGRFHTDFESGATG